MLESSKSAKSGTDAARMVAALGSELRLEDPEFYLRDPFAVYRRLRVEAPVFWYEPKEVWTVSRYDDACRVLRDARTFVSSRGVFLTEAKGGPRLFERMFGGGSGEALAVTDPPRHDEIRHAISRRFAPRYIQTLRPKIEDICEELINGLKCDAPFDFVEHVAAVLPIRVASMLLGIPIGDVQQILKWSRQLELSMASHVGRRKPEQIADEFYRETSEFVAFHLEHKRTHPGDDLLSLLLSDEVAQYELTRANVLALAVTMVTAGNDTTRALLSGLVSTLASHPEQLSLLVDDPSLARQATDEVLRFVTPGGRGFLRTAVAETEVSGTLIGKGEQVYVMLDSANRDPDVFDSPEKFNITTERKSGHIAFGKGPHVCIAASLVGLESEVFVQTLISRFPRWTVVEGQGRRIRSAFRNGWAHLPMMLS